MRRFIPLLTVMPATLVFASGVTLAINKIGTNGPDTLRGTDKDDDLDGRGGNDILFGLGGSDNLLDGEGEDWVLGGNEAESCSCLREHGRLGTDEPLPQNRETDPSKRRERDRRAD